MIIGKNPLYIDTDAFNKYGGVHILLDVLVSNTSEIGISLFRTSLTFAVMFLICAIGFDTIKKTGI